MTKRRGKTQGKARRRAAKDLTARRSGGVKAGDGGRAQFQDFHFTKRCDN